MSPSIAFLKSFLSNDFARSARDRGLKIDFDVVLYEVLDCGPSAVDLATISGAGVADPDEYHRRPYGIYLNRRSGSDLRVIKIVVIH